MFPHLLWHPSQINIDITILRCLIEGDGEAVSLSYDRPIEVLSDVQFLEEVLSFLIEQPDLLWDKEERA